MNLHSLRDSLYSENLVLLSSIIRRGQIVEQIQNAKRANQLPIFDCEQEWKVFGKLLSQLQQLNTTELLAYSLILEAQVGDEQHYPQWSQGNHLSSTANMISGRINPILLARVKPELFRELQFDSAYAFVKEFIENKLAEQ